MSYCVILTLREAKGKNLIRSSFFSLKPAIRDSSGRLAPQNDKEGVIPSLRLRTAPTGIYPLGMTA